jgi:predicted peroxiredoxin
MAGPSDWWRHAASLVIAQAAIAVGYYGLVVELAGVL